jgi:3-hydroxybutyryl-CoA dehydratase
MNPVQDTAARASECYNVGDRFVSPARTITDCDLHAFSALTGDWSALHTDEVSARNSVFGGRIAHGLLTISLASGLLLRLGPQAIMPRSAIGLYGLDRVRFISPVRIGDTVHVQAELRRWVPRGEEQSLLEWRCGVHGNDDRLCCIFDLLILCGNESRGK